MDNIRTIIVNTAKEFIGQKELKGNSGFKDSEFQLLMEAVGWETGQAWCAYFSELVWKIAYQQYDAGIVPTLDLLFSAGAVATWNNFIKYKNFPISNIPKPGSLIVFQTYKNGKSYWTGHIGIVSYYDDQIYTIEGNTNSKGGREGIEVAEKVRNLDFSIKSGLVLKGFIHPIE